jgi:hypothetical protein
LPGFRHGATLGAALSRRLSRIEFLSQQVNGQFQNRGKFRLLLPEQPTQVFVIRSALLAGNYRHRDLPDYASFVNSIAG